MVLIDNVLVEMPEAVSLEEAKVYVQEEIQLWKTKGKILNKVNIAVDGDEVIIKSTERSPISRIRRITGYLSEVSNFNEAKRAELTARVGHA
jgi:anaerobic ribonucleoside-triphosphate reductase activating protein